MSNSSDLYFAKNSGCYLDARASGDNSMFASDRYAFVDKDVDGLRVIAKDSNSKRISLQTDGGLEVPLKATPSFFATGHSFE